VGEARLIRMLIAQIKPTDEDFKTYRVNVADFARFFELSGGSAYALIDKAAESLAHSPITIREGESWLHTNWLSSAKYVRGSGYVELCFDKHLKPYLLQLKGYYTGYALHNTVNFNSGYTIRLFEILKSNEFKANTGGYFQKKFEYHELREMLGVDRNAYKLFADFRVNVIATAVKEINVNPDLSILKVDYLKTGRKVSHIVFSCERAKQTQIPLDSEQLRLSQPKVEHADYIKELMVMGIDEQVAYRWKRKYTVARLRDTIAYTKAMQKEGRIRESVS
jgi:plasmid replication initiation protein